jgi:phospholipid/cholesterol/gamma-HCH transport system substrate-binding protein
MQQRMMEIGVGMFVAAGMAALLMLALQVSNLANLSTGKGFYVTARFENIGGLKVKAPVTMGGVRVGRVAGIEFDQKRYEAVVHLLINEQYNRLPKDTSASIFTSGLLGEQYVNLEPGAEDQYLVDGDRIQLTQSALVMEKLIGQFIFNRSNENSSGN